jgi:hypothetical protein
MLRCRQPSEVERDVNLLPRRWVNDPLPWKHCRSGATRLRPYPIWMLTPQICEGSQFLDCDGYPFHGVSKINAYV